MPYLVCCPNTTLQVLLSIERICSVDNDETFVASRAEKVVFILSSRKVLSMKTANDGIYGRLRRLPLSPFISGDLANMQVTLIITQPNHRRLLRTPSSINFLLDLLFTFLTFDIVCWSIRRCHHLITVQYPESGTISESTTGSNRKVSRDVPDNRSCRQ